MNKTMKNIIYITGLLIVSAPSFASGGYAEIVEFDASKAFFGSSYSLYATIKSSDKDCNHYVDWWEAVSEDGKLLYRRTLGHPHSTEQPFNRGGSSSNINEDTVFYIRAHIHPDGYSNKGMKGSVKTSFVATDIPEGFASELAKTGEMPGGCDASRD